MSSNASLQPGNHRPIYLWAGPGTIRMNQLKFMGAPVDEQVHLEAHTPTGVRRVVDETGCNWIYLTHNWGFPPEQEFEDWESFSDAAKAYHTAGARVFAYIQTSNCVYGGSFIAQDWYALNARGRRVHYYTGRYMTCWQHPSWIAHLKNMINGAIQRGADGIFFDNPWYGGQPGYLLGSWHGQPGCYCQRCQEKYLQETGQSIPTRITPGEPLTDTYLRWRANQATLTLAHLAGYAKSVSSNILISANNFDAVMRPSFLIFGIDLKSLASIQDVIMIEDYGLPLYESKPKSRLANNALTIRTARALVKETPISVDPYDQGIGFDQVFSTRRYLQGIAEAAACGASMVVKGTEFVENGVFTLLTAPQFYETRREIGQYHTWLAANDHLFANRLNMAPVALLYPGDQLWQNWTQLAPLFFGAGQTLLAAGIPWKVVLPGDELDEVKVLVTCTDDNTPLSSYPDLSIIPLEKLPGWAAPRGNSLISRLLSRPADSFVDIGYRAYFNNKLARRLMDRAGVMRLFTGTPLFNLPSRTQQASLLAALPAKIYPRVRAKTPVLIEIWQRAGVEEIHLVNYSAKSQPVEIELDVPRAFQVLSPESTPPLLAPGDFLEFRLDIYAVLTARAFDSPS